MDLSKTKVATAQTNKSKLDVSSTHITTGSFMWCSPFYYRHMIPGEHIKGRVNVLSRLAPVAVPTYGRCRINMRAFYVPFRTVWRQWDKFIVDTIGSDASNTNLISNSPIVDNKTIVNYLLGVGVTVLDPTDPDDAAIISANRYDFSIGSTYYVLNGYGRWVVKLLHSLGYKIIWDDKNSFDWSALPLLCYAKVYYDYYSNSAYLNSADYNALAQLFETQNPSSVLVLSSTNIHQIFTTCWYTCYDGGNDVYLSAWDNPVSPNNGLISTNYSIDEFYSSGNHVNVGNSSSNLYYQPNMVQNSSNTTTIGTQFIHQALKSLTDFVKRNQLSGGYDVDRFLARYNIHLNNAESRRSIYVSSSSVDVDFGDVMQTVNNAPSGQPSNLGDYAGKGLGRGELNFDFQCDDFGLFIIIYSIQPQGHLFQGYDKNNRHVFRSQFYQPEFDNLGCDSCEKGEVYVSKNLSYGIAADYEGIWGFAPRYYEYKQKSDFVSGDFVSPYVMAGGSSWHLQRMLSDGLFTSIAQQTHSKNFMIGQDFVQYNRIFHNTDNAAEPFYLVFNIGAQSLAPCKSLFDTYEFEDEGKDVLINSNGAKVN